MYVYLLIFLFLMIARVRLGLFVMDTRLLVERVIFQFFHNGIFNFSGLNFKIIYRASFNNFFNGFIV